MGTLLKSPFQKISKNRPQSTKSFGLFWSHPPESNRRPADYEPDGRPLSYSGSVSIRSFSLPSSVQSGGFWMGNWMGINPPDTLRSRGRLDSFTFAAAGALIQQMQDLNGLAENVRRQFVALEGGVR
jgi:hypothetical protein